MRMCSIASGSSGNCIYVGSDTTHILLDVGISGKRIENGLKELALTGNDIDGIMITHEHADHIQGLGIMARRYEIPIYATKGTIEAIKKISSLGKIEEELFHEIKADERFTLKDIIINPMTISHDAAEPVAYRVMYGKEKISVCTDIGYYNDYTVECLKNSDAILIESNHDVNMLQVGPYPYQLKRRILGDRGHLSNENSGRLLSDILHDGLKHIFLGHLSKENNLPELAYETVRMEITMGDNPYKAEDFDIQVASRDALSSIVTLS